TVTVTRATSSAGDGSGSSGGNGSDNGTPQTPPPVVTPTSDKPVLNDKITDVQKVKEADQAALHLTAPKPFPDVPANSWSSKAVQLAQQLDIVQGSPDGNFHGSTNVTRAEFVTMMVKALHLDTTSNSGGTFSDTNGHWAESAIGALRAAGVIEGMGDGSFKPDQPISRAEITVILARVIVVGKVTGDMHFSDTSSSWARQYIEQLANADIVRGEGDGKFYPNSYATREQSVTMILRMLNICLNLDLQL
ncbi:hypothetical protein GC102_05900, partial [Paenibacillus sp. LMG 31460]